MHVRPPALAREQRYATRRHARHTRHGREYLLHAREVDGGARGVHAGAHRRESERHHIVHAQPQVHARHVHETLQEQPGRHQQRHGQCDLHRDERGAEPRGCLAARELSGAGADHADQVRPCAVQRGKEPEHQAGHDRERRREQHHAALELEPECTDFVGRHERADELERQVRDAEARHAADQRQQYRLGKQQCEQLPARRAQREAHTHLRGATGASSEQQVGDVRACDQQHHAGDPHQQQQRRLRVLGRVALPLPSVVHRHEARLEARERLVADTALQRHLDIVDDWAVERVQRGSGLRERDIRLPPTEDVHPVCPAILEVAEARLDHCTHRDRHVDRRPHAQCRAAELLRRDADDAERLAVDPDRPADHSQRTAEAVAPEIVPEHRHEVGADRRVVCHREQSARRRLQLQRGEV